MSSKFESKCLDRWSKSQPNDIDDNGFTASSPLKISKKSGSAFSLPAGPKFTCPGATPACMNCYAQKGRHVFSSVQDAFNRNFDFFLLHETIEDQETVINSLLKIIPQKMDLFRIHESGDFHSQWAVDVWAQVISKRPDINFWAYTRSFDFNYSKILKNNNFTLWASTDSYNEKKAIAFVNKYKDKGVKHAYGPWQSEQNIPENSFICPVTSGKLNVLGACEECKLCVVKDRVQKNVVFLRH